MPLADNKILSICVLLGIRETKNETEHGNNKYGREGFRRAGRHVEAIERKAEALCRRQEDVSLKKWLDNQDVCDVLGISKRTLQTYREKGLLPFSRIRHKIFYKPEDVGKLLQSSHYPNTAAL